MRGACHFFIFLLSISSFASCLSPIKSLAEGQDLLGSALNQNWRALNQLEPSGWTLANQILQTKPGYFGSDLVSLETFKNFVLVFEFRLSHGANSGIKYVIQKEYGNIGLEYQLIDNSVHLDSMGNDKRKTAALYDLFEPTTPNLLIENQINAGCIIFNNGQGQHWLNGVKVLEFDLNSLEFAQRLSISKFKKFAWFGTFPSGHILVQHHGDLVNFSKIYVYPLPD